MKLHDLTVGDRFSFIGKHRGKVFEVIEKGQHLIIFKDVATGEKRHTWSNRLTFRMEVWLESPNKVFEFTPDELATINDALLVAHRVSAEVNEPESTRDEINRVYCKINGLPERGGSEKE